MKPPKTREQEGVEGNPIQNKKFKIDDDTKNKSYAGLSHAELLQMLNERDNTIEEQNNTIEEQTKVIEKITNKIYMNSIKLVIRERPKMLLKNVGNHSSNTRSANHEKAEAEEKNLDLLYIRNSDELSKPSALLGKFELNAIKGDEQEELTSKERPFVTEMDISTLVIAALEDAMKLTRRKLYVHHEFSLFSDRPDHLVLYDSNTNDPILAVEDKKPQEDSTSSISAGSDAITGRVLGQIFDYLMDLRAFGHSAPFVVLSTFTRSWLFWYGHESGEIVEFNNNKSQNEPKVSTPIHIPEQEQKTPSPPKLVKVTAKDTVPISTYGPIKRSMNRSQAFGSEELVHLLYTALICSLKQNPAVSVKEIKFYERNAMYDDLALKFDNDSYEWVYLKIKAGSRVQYRKQGTSSRPKFATPRGDVYFVTGKIARGSTSKVYYAFDKNGKPCVIKMVVKRFEQNRKLLPIKSSRKMGKKLCKLEVTRLTTFYTFLKGKVSYKELNKFPCVVMPFFKSLEKDDRTALPQKDIEDCLLNFNEPKKKYWKYRNDDIRWRHVGYYDELKDKKLVMFDLAELEEVVEDEFKTSVRSQVQALVSRLPNPQSNE